jgi:hypothetical protein
MNSTTTSSQRAQKGLSLFGMLIWSVLIGFVAVMVMKIFPSVNEYWTIQRALRKIRDSGAVSVPEIRSAFNRQRDIEYSISSINGSDLEIDTVGDKVVVRFAYDKEIEIMSPVFLLIKYRGSIR